MNHSTTTRSREKSLRLLDQPKLLQHHPQKGKKSEKRFHQYNFDQFYLIYQTINIFALIQENLIYRPNSSFDRNIEHLGSDIYGTDPEHSSQTSSTNTEQLLSVALVAEIDRRDSEGGDSDDVPPPLPSTSPPKLSPDSTLTWNHKERTPLKLGKY